MSWGKNPERLSLEFDARNPKTVQDFKPRILEKLPLLD